MIARLGAASVHVLTASGAVLALLALRAVHQGDWQMMFVWLGAALIVDAVDGPLARRLSVKTVLPRFSGERLDLIVDYLTYVAVPAYALTEATLLPEAARLPAASAILLSSLFHVADLDSKTEEGYFVGFPAIWNIVLLYLFALGSRAGRRARRGRSLRAAHLRADACRPSVPRRAAALAHLRRRRALGRRRRRGVANPFPVAALGQSVADRDRNLSGKRRPRPLACTAGPGTMKPV